MRKTLYSLLFSGLGVFSYLLLINYTNLPLLKGSEVSLVWVCAFVIIAINLLGFSIIKISSWITNNSIYYNTKWRIVLLYIVVSILLFLLNYGLLTTAKFIAGVNNPFYFYPAGTQVLLIVWLVELVIVGLLLLNHYMLNALRFQQKASYLQDESNHAKYIALQNQLNPHFLFNSLNTLIAEIEYNPSNATEFTRKLSDVYRYVLQCQDKTTVTLQSELDFMQSFVFLHTVRLGNYITINNQISKDLGNLTLPPLTLQLLIENVIKHNSISSSKPMTIFLYIKKGMLVVSNTVSPKISSAVSGRGLKNLSNRYMLLFNRDIEVISTSVLFTVKVPINE